MDVLSDVLSWLRVEGTATRRSEFTAPWGISYPTTDHFAFLLVEQGSCCMWFEEGSGSTLALECGDLVMLSPGRKSSLADQRSTPTVPYTEILKRSPPPDIGTAPSRRKTYPPLSYGAGGRKTAIRGWGLSLESYEQHPLLSLLPPFVQISYEQRSSLPWLETTLRFIGHETREAGEGSEMITTRLVDLLFVQVIRTWFQSQSDGKSGWVGALRDPTIGQALRLLHQQPDEAWTVQALAKAVGMSRSSFSARFQGLVGSAPLKYLTELRMHLAAHMLKGEEGLTVAEIAVAVGYDTESSFGRAFKRYFGRSPGAFRKHHAQ